MSVSAATAVTPHGAVGAAAAGAYHHDRRHHTRRHHHNAAIGLAAAIGATMPARAATACGFRRAEAGNGAQGQNCCEKVLHVLCFLPFLTAMAARYGTYSRTAEWNMNVVICHGASHGAAARKPSTSSLYLAGASRKTKWPVFATTSARPLAIPAASALASSAFCPIFARSASGAFALPGAL